MPTDVAFLRAINVGGRFATMAGLREGLTLQGFGEVESYIQSGNLRLTSTLRSAAKFELTNARMERGGAVATTRDWKVVSALAQKWGI